MSKEEKAISLVVENLENILSNPANNHLPISVMQVIETSVRLLKVESSQLTAYKEALSLAYDLIHASTEYEVGITRYKEGLLKINELLKPKP